MQLLAPILAKIGAWLTSKLGAAAGSVLLYVLEKIVMRGANAVAKWWANRQRSQDQAEKEKKVEGDVEQSKPRDEETRKREDDWMNS